MPHASPASCRHAPRRVARRRYGVGPTATADRITISGAYTPSTGSFRLTLSYHSGRVVTYTGTLICPNTLRGMATEGGSPYALVFYRGGVL